MLWTADLNMAKSVKADIMGSAAARNTAPLAHPAPSSELTEMPRSLTTAPTHAIAA